MFTKIIVPVDISTLDKGADIFRKAASLLDEGGKIILLHVVEEVPSYLAIDMPADLIANATDEAQDKLVKLRDDTGIDAEIELRSGPPAREILACAKERGADLIIIASHRPDFSNYLLGSTADRVVRHAVCSVLVRR
ncbi:universal stress protein [Martelella mediterranea]|uniref:Universal stress protein F n=1 Tax=Martelella mediterranea DSM 17316 TaxID=1122214 RepID=A0A1U9YYJ8_9HYPH|nr:universal stress protein [Martelella mediterranea]AQZ50460.1 Universal stress protein F [Martelella mediterranea DSM 17316]|tara:strand:+ start:219 stop:629 length:411 start_codon:yes stop_codon:yes gene_type:complete